MSVCLWVLDTGHSAGFGDTGCGQNRVVVQLLPWSQLRDVSTGVGRGLCDRPQPIVLVNPVFPPLAEAPLPCWRGMPHWTAGSSLPRGL